MPTEQMQRFIAAQEEARRIARVAEQAVPAEKAASWFAQYGKRCVGPEAGTAWWSPSFAGSVAGAKEAAAYMGKAMTAMLPTIIAEARDMAEADMAALMALLPGADGGPNANPS